MEDRCKYTGELAQSSFDAKQRGVSLQDIRHSQEQHFTPELKQKERDVIYSVLDAGFTAPSREVAYKRGFDICKSAGYK